MWYTRIGHPSEKLWPYEFLHSCRCSISCMLICEAPESDIRVKTYDHFNFPRASVVQFRASRYIKRLNRTFVWKVMTIWISRELPLFNFEHLDMWYTRIGHPSEKLCPFEFLHSFRCSISCISICEAPESDIRVKIYDHLNISRASIDQFQASRYMIRLTRTSEFKLMTILISRELPFFNFERLVISSTWIGPPCKKLWPLEFL